MLYLYDSAICDDLKRSFNSEDSEVVKVVSPDIAVDVVSQIRNDEFKFPAVVLTRNPYSVDSTRINFTRYNQGVVSVMDTETNLIYNEKVIPINLSYNLTVLTTNTADMDELTRELMFKYMSEYFLTIKLPYEADRNIRFGIKLDTSQDIESSSGLLEYLQDGKAYQNIIHLVCDGAVLLSYTPHQMYRFSIDEEIDLSPVKYNI